jgi:uncharacterized membrane protein YfcA
VTLVGLLVASIVVAVAALVQGAVGFGLVLVAAPIVTMVDPRLVPGPMLVSAFALTVVMSLRDREGIDGRGIGVAFVGRIPGSLIGAWLLTLLTPAALELVVAGTVILGVAMTGSGLRIPLSRGSLLGAGFLSGVMGTTTAIGGPPIAIVYQHAPGRDLRGTLSGFFVVGSLVSIVTLALVGRFGWADLRLGAALLPATAVGYVLSGPAVRVMDRGYTRLGVLAVSTAAALVLLARRVV